MIGSNNTRLNTHFERAIFLSWYCSKGDCRFCYMSTQKEKLARLKDPKLAKRTAESVLAEAIISKVCGWEIEFLSGGYESYSPEELLFLLKHINEITKARQWLNIGVLNREELGYYLPYITGVSGAIECINPMQHDIVCPSKSISEIVGMFKIVDEINDAAKSNNCSKHIDNAKNNGFKTATKLKNPIKKSITIIIGIGESEQDIPLLAEFIKQHKIDRVTFYALNPHKATIFKSGPTTEYYLTWIKAIRAEFPDLDIVAGSWVDRIGSGKDGEIKLLLDAGVDSITKFPSIKLFGSGYAQEFEHQAKLAGRVFKGTMTKKPELAPMLKKADALDIDSDLKDKIMQKLKEYHAKM